MAKQGQHDYDGNNPDISRGVNKPHNAVHESPGTYKTQETYKENAYAHKGNHDEPQGPGETIWVPDRKEELPKKDRVS